MEDMVSIMDTNLRCLPENYGIRYYLFTLLTWPELTKVAVDPTGRVVGYVLAKIEDEKDPKKRHGHVTSVATLDSHRKHGLATKLMRESMKAMKEVYDANHVSLHVRQTNRAAKHLYTTTLGFRTHKLDRKYYQDGEHAYEMHCTLTREGVGLPAMTDASPALLREAIPTVATGTEASGPGAVDTAAASSGAAE